MFKRLTVLLAGVAVLVGAVLVYRWEETRDLSGFVRDGETRAPIPDAQVTVAGRAARTDVGGHYTISLPRGKFALAATGDGYLTAQAEINAAELFKHTFAIDFELAPNQVNGVVRDAETLQALASAQIKTAAKTVSANAQGAFQVRGLKSGAIVSANMPGYQAAAIAYTGQNPVELALAPNAVAVVLTDAYTRAPIPNAQVQFGAQTAPTDPNGIAVLRRVAPGAALRANAAGYESGSVTFTGTDIALTLRPNTLAGVLTDSGTGQPIANALVYLGGQSATTNAKGAYHFDNVPAKAVLTIKAIGYRRTQVETGNTTKRDVKLAPFLVKAIHIPMGLTTERVRALVDLVNKTELNSIVLSVKSERGYLAWDSQVALAKQIGANNSKNFDLAEVLQRCKSHNIYCIARLAVFQDTLLATERPAMAIRYANGKTFTENGGAAWTNPLNTDIWDYNIALAKELAALGFDEIQFDYVRFPGYQEGIYFGANATEDARIAAISGFLSRAQKELRASGVFVSADVFGLTVATDDDQYTGQRLRDLGAYLDYVSPMVYPDTWDSPYLVTNGLGVRNCRDAVQCPYDIIFNSYKRAAEKTTTKVRLWLQAYSGRGDYGIAQYKTQKKAAQEAGSYGWMFWNGQGVYDARMLGAPGE